MNVRYPRQRLALDYLKAIDAHNIPALQRRLLTQIEVDETAGINRIDGYPTRTPGNGGEGGGGGRHIIVTDEHGRPDRIPVTTVEAAVIDLDRATSDPDPYHTALQNALRSLQTAAIALDEVQRHMDRADALRSTEDLAEWVPQCWLASHYKLPVDMTAFGVFTRTTFEGYLQPQWDEPRPVSRFVYDFVRQHHRLPSQDEMERRAQGRRVFVRDHRSAS